jgi:ABC-2 type transport system permease protein
VNGIASFGGFSSLPPWLLWFVVPALTMGLISDELRSGTFEQLATLPLRDEEIVLGKYIGFAMLAALLVAGLAVYPMLISFTAEKGQAGEWGVALGTLTGLFLVSLTFGAMGLFASSLAKNQVVALILGIIFCTIFFFVGQFYGFFPGVLAKAADFIGLTSHLESISRGVWDIRDIFYFLSMIVMFLYLTVQRLSTRRF